MIDFHIDTYGLIVQKDLDGGDTAGREGDYWFAHKLLESKEPDNFDNVLNHLQVSPGVFIRHPVNYNDPKDFSRDQTVPLIMAMGEMKRYETLKLLLSKQLANGFKYQNGDFGGPADIGYYIRAFRMWFLYPLLLLGDAQLLINTLFICGLKAKEPNWLQKFLGKHVHYIFIQGEPNNKDGIPQDVYGLKNTSTDINHTLALLQAKRRYPTPISYIARKLYKWFRPGGIQLAWDNYFNVQSGANPFNDLYRPLIDNM